MNTGLEPKLRIWGGAFSGLTGCAGDLEAVARIKAVFRAAPLCPC